MDRLLTLVEDSADPPRLQLDPSFSVIAEIKATSPAEGALATGETFDPTERAALYASGGAAAVSVLTEPDRFHGDLMHLADAARTLGPHGVPAMRKDFLVDEYQVVEARLAGAGGVLLIVAMLDDDRIAQMIEHAHGLDLFVLIECFDIGDIQRVKRLLSRSSVADAADAGRVLIGVNTRDLRTLDVDATRLERLVSELPVELPRVAESGLKQPEDAASAVQLGYTAALIGTALMRAESPSQTLQAFVAAGRGAK